MDLLGDYLLGLPASEGWLLFAGAQTSVSQKKRVARRLMPSWVLPEREIAGDGNEDIESIMAQITSVCVGVISNE